MNERILTLLGFASKSGKLAYGFDMSVESVKKGKSKLLLTADDVSEKSQKEVIYFADKSNVEYIILKGISTETLSNAIGKSCGIVSVNDSGFAKAIGGNAND